MHALMREAIGQLMTGPELTKQIIPAVGIPYTEQSYNLACKWQAYPQIKNIGIQFILVHKSGELTVL